ncbi:cerebellar degeneration-related protein 2 isoform X2 [Prorops nasuta]|uniref:cerebellar degeneration-related protein 2 isoform X2 n=1 Tax=Prorops nasuta TaxID=863751 RepID=UPI0034CEC453
MSGPSVDVVWDPQTQLNSLDCWDYSIELACLQGPEDLQLAAELGKTLLERNKELENNIKLHQCTIEEQAQEIEHMKKQTAVLKEVNNSRLKIYEQLEVSIQDLERANHRLVIENSSDKKLIKSQCVTIENLEARCDELQKRIDELNTQRDSLLRQQAANQAAAQYSQTSSKTPVMQDGSIPQMAAPHSPKSCLESTCDVNVRLASNLSYDEEMTELMRQVQEARSQRAREQKKNVELGQQLASLLQENSALEEQLAIMRSKAQDIKSLQDEISTLEEVRQGHLCGRCLRSVDSKIHDELLDYEEYDDLSIAEAFMSESQLQETEPLVQETSRKSVAAAPEERNGSVYKELIQKYQALVEIQNQSSRRKNFPPPPCKSLQEELEMSGEFNNFHNAPTEHEIRAKTETNGKKMFSATPTDFSEAETSSSGFLEETSNKSTQTEERAGFLLCSIADGEDCKFSIYDDNYPLESRFRKTPEYKLLFTEIINNLKRAAEAKEEGKLLPSCDESCTKQDAEPSTIMEEDAPSEATDDNLSVMSSVISSVVSEPVYRIQAPIQTEKDRKQESTKGKHVYSQPGRSQLEYLSISVRQKRSSTKKKNLDTPDVIPTTNPKFIQAKPSGRRKFRPLNLNEPLVQEENIGRANRRSPSARGRRVNHEQKNYSRNVEQNLNNSSGCEEYKRSSASVEVARLRRLEMSYAEALRTPNRPKTHNHHRRS